MNGRERFERQRSIPIVLLICGLFCLLSASSTAAPEQGGDKSAKVKNPFGQDKEAIEAGQQHFQAGCAFCHGTRGEGGRGPFLSESGRVRSLSDEKLFNLLRQGIPGTPMPSSSLDDTKMWQLVSFLRSLHFSASQENVPGDPGSGQAVFGRVGCSGCHMLKGQGGLVGPDLSNIGGSRSLEKLRQAIVKPDASVVPGFRSISVQTRGGHQLAGVARNHSNYSIQMIDLKGELHLFLREELEKVSYKAGSIMPAAPLSPDELQNLLAFLSRQVLSSEKVEERKQ